MRATTPSGRATDRATLLVAATLAAVPCILLPGPARAQGPMRGPIGSLGGYGAATITSYYGGGGGYLPYNGDASGFVPYGGPSGGIGAPPLPRRLPQTSIGGTMIFSGTPIGGASLAGAGTRGGMAMGAGRSGRGFGPIGSFGGSAMGGGGGMPSSSAMPRRAAGPGFGYPFRMPPSLTGGAAGGMGMP